MVPTWWLEWDSNLWPSRRKAPNLPLSHHAHNNQFEVLIMLSLHLLLKFSAFVCQNFMFWELIVSYVDFINWMLIDWYVSRSWDHVWTAERSREWPWAYGLGFWTAPTGCRTEADTVSHPRQQCQFITSHHYVISIIIKHNYHTSRLTSFVIYHRYLLSHCHNRQHN